MLVTLLTILLIIDIILLIIFIIALQQGTEGGMAATLGGANNSGLFGASGGIDFIVGTTWVLGFLFFVLSFSLAWLKTHNYYRVSTVLEKFVNTDHSSETEKSVAPEELSNTQSAPSRDENTSESDAIPAEGETKTQ